MSTKCGSCSSLEAQGVDSPSHTGGLAGEESSLFCFQNDSKCQSCAFLSPDAYPYFSLLPAFCSPV